MSADDREPLDPLDAHIARLAGPEPPEDVADRVLAALRRPEAVSRLYWTRADAFARRLVPAAAVALLASIAILAALVFSSRWADPTERERPAASPAPGLLTASEEAIDRNLRDETWLVSLRRTRRSD